MIRAPSSRRQLLSTLRVLAMRHPASREELDALVNDCTLLSRHIQHSPALVDDVPEEVWHVLSDPTFDSRIRGTPQSSLKDSAPYSKNGSVRAQADYRVKETDTTSRRQSNTHCRGRHPPRSSACSHAYIALTLLNSDEFDMAQNKPIEHSPYALSSMRRPKPHASLDPYHLRLSFSAWN